MTDELDNLIAGEDIYPADVIAVSPTGTAVRCIDFETQPPFAIATYFIQAGEPIRGKFVVQGNITGLPGMDRVWIAPSPRPPSRRGEDDRVDGIEE